MTFQKLLLDLSYYKDIRVECFVCNGECTIHLTDWWYGNELLTEKIDIKHNAIPKEILEKFKPYIK